MFAGIGGIGWLLGVIGFFRADRARAEVAELRRIVDQLAPRTVVSQEEAAADLGVEAPEPDIARHEIEDVPPPPFIIEAPPAPEPVRDLETLITTRWGVWLGAAALLFAGVFLIRYAADHAVLGPAARCALAGVLGLVLLGGAEWLRRHEGPPIAGPLGADQAPGGLAAGGVAILFGAAYGAGPFYGLLPPLLGFAALAAASMAGLAAALRFGPLTAVIGLVCAKVFLIDMSGLTGLWRVLSFLGLALIGLGAVQRRFVLPGKQG